MPLPCGDASEDPQRRKRQRQDALCSNQGYNRKKCQSEKSQQEPCDGNPAAGYGDAQREAACSREQRNASQSQGFDGLVLLCVACQRPGSYAVVCRSTATVSW